MRRHKVVEGVVYAREEAHDEQILAILATSQSLGLRSTAAADYRHLVALVIHEVNLVEDKYGEYEVQEGEAMIITALFPRLIVIFVAIQEIQVNKP